MRLLDRSAQRVDGLGRGRLSSGLLDQLTRRVQRLRPRVRSRRRVGHLPVVIVDAGDLVGQPSVKRRVAAQVPVDRRRDPLELLLDLALGVLEALAEQNLPISRGQALLDSADRLGNQLAALIERTGGTLDPSVGRRARRTGLP